MFLSLVVSLCNQDVNISACVSGRGQLIVGDHEGYVYLVNKQLSLNMFKAYEIRVSHLHQMKQHNLLVSIGVCHERNILYQYNNTVILRC